MSPANPVTARIRGPRGKGRVGKGGKPADSSSAKRSTARNTAGARASRGAAYLLSAHEPRELPAPGVPEIAFAGRSNAGKSSAINALANRRRLAFVSKTPGRTQLINFFSLGSDGFLVDLPGYGYAGVPGAVRRHWETLVGHYIASRASIALVVVVMDVRHPLTELDWRLLDWLQDSGRRAHILLTKADKLSTQAAKATLAKTHQALSQKYAGGSVQLFSSLRKKGIEDAIEAAGRAIDAFGAQKTRTPAN